MRPIPAILLRFLGACASTRAAETEDASAAGEPRLLARKRLGESRAFCERLGCQLINGDPEQNWLILQNRTATIGLFQDMFDGNIHPSGRQSTARAHLRGAGWRTLSRGVF